MSRQKKKDEGGPGIGWLLGAAAGAAIAGAAAYGVKKLVDYLDEQEKQAATNNEYEPDSKPPQQGGNSGARRGPGERNPLQEGGTSRVSQGPSLGRSDAVELQSSARHSQVEKFNDHEAPLQYSLEDYHNKYVNIAKSEMDRAKEVVGEIKDVIRRHFQEKYPHLVTELKDCGSVVEGLKVVRPDEFDVMIPLHVHPDLFQLVYEPNVPGFYVLKPSEFGPESYSQPLEIFLSDEEASGDQYLSPEKLRNFFQSHIQKAINGITKYSIHSEKKGPSILLEVTYDGGVRTSIDFVPVMVVEEKMVVAKPHPEYLHHQNPEYEKFWREAFSTKEWRAITSLPSSACHKKCLKIVKAARLNNPSQLGMLNSYIYKTLLLHMLDYTDPEEWAEECLSERFVDFLNLLHDHLRKGHLPHRFNPAVNLLDQYSSTSIEGVRNHLSKVLSGGKYAKLLNTMY